jgi:hypothetical protein
MTTKRTRTFGKLAHHIEPSTGSLIMTAGDFITIQTDTVNNTITLTDNIPDSVNNLITQYDSQQQLNSSPSVGDFAFIKDNRVLLFYNGNGWQKLKLISG